MKHKIYKRILVSFSCLAIVLLGGTVLLQSTSASGNGGTVSISPSSASVVSGGTFTVSVVVNTNGVAVSSDTVTLTYNKDKLQVTQVTPSSSFPNFNNFADDHNGTIQGGGSNYGPANGGTAYANGSAVNLLSVTFQAKVGGATDQLKLLSTGANPTEVDNADGSGSIGATLGGPVTVTLTQPACPAGYTGTYPSCVAPPTCPSGYTGTYPNCVAPVTPTCPSGQTGTPPNCKPATTGTGGTGGTGNTGTGSTGGTSTGTGTTGNTPSGGGTTTAPPKTEADGSTVGTKQVQFTKAVIATTSKVPTQVYIAYGTTSKSLDLQTALSALATTHEISLDDANLAPGQTYYYMVVSKDAQGNITKSSVESFTTKGIDVTIVVLDANHKPVVNKQVTLHSTAYNATTDAKGQAVFKNVAPGAHELTYASGKKMYTEKLAVDNTITTATDGTQSAKPQNFSVVYNLTQTSHTGAIVSATVLLVLVAAGVAVFFLFPDKLRLALANVMPKKTTGPAITTAPITVTEPTQNTPQVGGVAQVAQPEEPQPGSTITPHNESAPVTPPALPADPQTPDQTKEV